MIFILFFVRFLLLLIDNVNRPTCQQQHVVNGAIPVRIQQNLRKTRRKNKDDPNVNRYHSG